MPAPEPTSATRPAFAPVVPPADPAVEPELAWIGDAALALWAREHVLRERRQIDTEAFRHLTANQHLAGAGRPTLVEAEIGVVYRAEGLAAAFAYIQARRPPMFKRQEANRKRGRRGRIRIALTVVGAAFSFIGDPLFRRRLSFAILSRVATDRLRVATGSADASCFAPRRLRA